MLLELDDAAEVAQGFLPLLLEDVDLASGDVRFDIAWVPEQGLG